VVGVRFLEITYSLGQKLWKKKLGSKFSGEEDIGYQGEEESKLLNKKKEKGERKVGSEGRKVFNLREFVSCSGFVLT
jgi:hypothetical protein